MTKPTEAQMAARMRNWGIRGLRSLQEQAHMLTGDRRAKVQALIDEELRARGADDAAAHYKKVAERFKRNHPHLYEDENDGT